MDIRLSSPLQSSEYKVPTVPEVPTPGLPPAKSSFLKRLLISFGVILVIILLIGLGLYYFAPHVYIFGMERIFSRYY